MIDGFASAYWESPSYYGPIPHTGHALRIGSTVWFSAASPTAVGGKVVAGGDGRGVWGIVFARQGHYSWVVVERDVVPHFGEPRWFTRFMSSHVRRGSASTFGEALLCAQAVTGARRVLAAK